MGKLIYVKNTLNDLKREIRFDKGRMSELKKNTEILVIDDNPFPYIDTLRKHEFSIVQKEDLTTLKDASAYDIILCDIRGVGRFLKSKYDGAALIKALKDKYPTKRYIAYTANEYDTGFQKYLDYADVVVPKGTYSIDDWVMLLEQEIEDYVDPVKQWRRIRDALLNSDVKTIDIARIESKYVEAVKKKNPEILNSIYGVDENIRTVVIEALTSLIVKVMFS